MARDQVVTERPDIILTREYGIPCLMNAKLRSIYHEDRVEIEPSAKAMTAEAQFTGESETALIWKVATGVTLPSTE
jgi:hypothetical protein